MAAVDFPASPTVGQIFDPGGGLSRYVWTGQVWNAYGTSQPKTWVGVVPPSNPADGDFWWASDTGILYLRYNDGNSVQWVAAQPAMDLPSLDTRYALGPGQAVVKIASGVTAANGQILCDVTLPAGYNAFELIIGNVLGLLAGGLQLRMSADGTTFVSTTYLWYYNAVIFNAGTVATTNNPGGNSGSPSIPIMGAVGTDQGSYKGSAKLVFPVAGAASLPSVLISSAYYAGGNVWGHIDGVGFAGGISGPAKAVRIYHDNAGNGLAAGATWQLNGWK